VLNDLAFEFEGASLDQSAEDFDFFLQKSRYRLLVLPPSGRSAVPNDDFTMFSFERTIQDVGQLS
jgi:hypothetical protein